MPRMPNSIQSAVDRVVHHLREHHQPIPESLDWQVGEPDEKGATELVAEYGQPPVTLTVSASHMTPTRMKAEYLLADLATYQPKEENFILKGMVTVTHETA